LLELLDLLAEASRADFSPPRLRALGIDPAATRRADMVRRQLSRGGGGRGRAAGEDKFEKEANRAAAEGVREEALLLSVLTGYPDRVARRRAKAAGAEKVELVLAGGGRGAATLAPESVVRRAEFVVAVDAEERRGPRQRAEVFVRLASAIEPEWLIDLFPERVAESVDAEWNAQAERAEVFSRLSYDGLTLTEGNAGDVGGEAASKVLAAAALDAGVEAFVERDVLDGLLARIEFAARALPEANFPALAEDDLRAALVEMCEGRRGFSELRDAARRGELTEALRRRLTPEQTRLLASAAPDRVALAGGRQLKVNYARGGRDPWAASRLQDFFGMREGPRVAGGRVPLVLHLLAPNHRPVQVTTDLAGFWQRHYPQTRRELSRRYPRHSWPLDPLDASK
jgi:ATP-dependent helicase HrpB